MTPDFDSNRKLLFEQAQQGLKIHSNILREILINIRTRHSLRPLIELALKSVEILIQTLQAVPLDLYVLVLTTLKNYLKSIREEEGVKGQSLDLLSSAVAELAQLASIKPNFLNEHLRAHLSTCQLLIAQLQESTIKNEKSPDPSFDYKKEGEPGPQENDDQSKAALFDRQSTDSKKAKREEEASSRLDPALFELFCIELENQTRILNHGLIEWERQPTQETIDELMRAAHSIKGAARVVLLEPIVRLAHAMEDYFVDVRRQEKKGEEKSVEHVFQAIDLLSRLARLKPENVGLWLQAQSSDINQLADAIHPLPAQSNRPSVDQKNAKHSSQADEEKKTPIKEDLFAKANRSEATIKEANKQSDTVKPFQMSFGKDRILRVTAQNLNRLMGLAGESLVESRWLYPFGMALQKLKKDQRGLSNRLRDLRESLEEGTLTIKTQQYLADLQSQLYDCHHQLTERLNELDGFIRQQANLSDRLYQEVINSRMRPFADGVEGFPRLVRDLSRQLGKRIKLVIDGKSTPIDRDILEKLESPLSHLLRNAVDHGIEKPQDRQRAGKPIEGVIKLEARHQGGMLSIIVSDDGQGLNIKELKKLLINRSILGEELAARLSDFEIANFLFEPGFSTTEQVTEISGRGLGLNIVQTVVQEVGGIVRVFFVPGKSMTFQLQLPLTLSVIRALLVEISGEAYAFPLSRIDQAFLIDLKQVEMVENRQFFHYEDQNIGLIPAWQALELSEPSLPAEILPVITVSNRQHVYGLVVDRLIGEKELVVQELDARLGKIQDISAGALMEDGNPVLIIDTEEIVQSIDRLLSKGSLKNLVYEQNAQADQLRKRVLVVDDSLTVREVECRLLKNYGYEVETAVNGMDGWNAVRLGRYDLIITDIDMPRMNGIELVRSIKTNPAFKHLPVMIVSYKESERDRMQGLEAGADYYLTKSGFDDETLLEAVRDLIGSP